MKKFLCAVLAVCMLCGAMALVGCKKGGNNNGNSESSSQSQSVNGENPEGGGEFSGGWDL